MKFESLRTALAWEFTHLERGTFRRNKAAFAHHQYPILGPLPTHGPATAPKEHVKDPGPFLYFVVDDTRTVVYVGKSQEANVLKRWIRPDNSAPPVHYWTHSTASGGCVFNIAAGIHKGRTYQLRYAPVAALQELGFVNAGSTLPQAERLAIHTFRPTWNVT
jgi:hypothetical protein